ncbi:hypothetical protein [Crocosphaera sp.]|uniref:hypothetical protein n=1 Tax=Crocosphaera sp. TaxID=2729996 RepID=UPI00262BD07D|nr:hypothetical protein [Crocosphaera sp.]MDJ0581043.1 hypothetical protein [Crocosphaera sp.]
MIMIANFTSYLPFKKQDLIKALLLLFFSFLLTSCQSKAVPLEFAPDGKIVQEAITLQLEQRLNPLSEQLKTTKPRLNINNINVQKIDPVTIGDLASYHLTGTYNLKLILPRQEIKQTKNNFDIYLQRQAEGKTWRLLSKDNKTSTEESSWRSYLIKL